MDFIFDFFAENFSSCIWLATILVALIPTLESKIAIPFAMNPAFWGEAALPAWQAFLFSYIGAMLPCFLVILLTKKIKSKTCGFVVEKINNRYAKKLQAVENKSSNFKKYLMLTTFVALPLPLTGVWSGSVIAGLTNLDTKKCILTIAIGAFISCLIVTLLCVYFSNSITLILIISFAMILLFLLGELILSLIKRHKKRP